MNRNQEDLLREVVARGIDDLRVLEALREVPRAGFVPPEFAGQAYRDVPVPIAHGQVTSQPSLVAKMVEALGLTDSERVLEVGTGYGFQTALLCRLSSFVFSVERFAGMAEIARTNLTLHGIGNVEVVVGDGTKGLPEQAPFEAIILTAAFPEVPPPLAEQLARGGRLVQPVGPGGAEEVVLFEKVSGGLVRCGVVSGAHFVRLHGQHGFGE